MKVFLGVSYDRDHETKVVGVCEHREGARRLVEQVRGEMLFFSKYATDGPDGGASLDDVHGDMVGNVLAFDVFGEAKLEWLYDSPDGCLSARSVSGETYCVENMDDGKWVATIGERTLGDGPLDECLIMCRMTEDQAILDAVQNSPLFEESGNAEFEAYVEGLRAFAYWKDGVQYVGTCGVTLADAIEGAKRKYAIQSAN